MPKSRKRRNAKTKPKLNRRELHRRLTVPVPDPRPKHPGYTQICTTSDLIAEFGEEGASWLHDEYEGPLTVAEFRLEQCIRRDAFMLDDPFTGPEVVTAEKISKLLEMTFQVVTTLAARANVLSEAQAREAAEIEADGPIDHAADGADVMREAFQAGAVFLNDRDRWDFGGGEAQHG